MKKEVFRMENVVGDESDITNLDNMNFHVNKGEILGLIPVNGCGRQNLLRLLSRNRPIRLGRIYAGEKLVNSHIHSDNSLNQVYLLEQKSKLIAELTVLDNVYVLQKTHRKVFYNRAQVRKQFCWLCESMKVNIRPDVSAYKLSGLDRIIVEIMKGIEQGAKLIVMNGIGECISFSHLNFLKNIMVALAKQGMSFLYFCNNYEEITDSCDRILFMKDGRDLKLFERNEFNRKWLQKMIYSFSDISAVPQHNTSRVILEVKGLRTIGGENKNLIMRAGQCFVLYDKNRVMDSFLKLKVMLPCEIWLEGEQMSFRKLEKVLGTQVMLLAPDPTRSMIYKEFTFIENLCLGLGKKAHEQIVSEKVLKSVKEEYGEALGECINEKDVSALDIFELYKLIYYRVHLLNPSLAIILNPFKNTDINLRRHVVELILRLKEKGIALLVASVDINASMLVADTLGIVETEGLTEVHEAKDFGLINTL